MNPTEYNLKTMSINDIKALAYDLKIQIEGYSGALNTVQQELIERLKAEQEKQVAEKAEVAEKASAKK
jgi:hypothetical protein